MRFVRWRLLFLEAQGKLPQMIVFPSVLQSVIWQKAGNQGQYAGLSERCPVSHIIPIPPQSRRFTLPTKSWLEQTNLPY
jgi:hypothetical protein